MGQNEQLVLQQSSQLQSNDDDEQPEYLKQFYGGYQQYQYQSPQTKTVWSNPNNCKIESVKAIIPCSLLFTMNKIEQLMDHGSEFGLYLKGELKDGILVVSEEFFVPQQEVTGASVDFKEDGDLKWNGVIHKHPGGVMNFSGTDDGSINGNHLFTLLYESKEIKKGEINLDLKGVKGKIRLQLNIEIEFPTVSISKEMIDEKIKTKSVISYSPSNPTFVGGVSVPPGRNSQIWKSGFFPGCGQQHQITRFGPQQDAEQNSPVIEFGGVGNKSQPSDQAIKRAEHRFGQGFNPQGMDSWDMAGIFAKPKESVAGNQSTQDDEPDLDNL